jgi:hypothetical protein
MSLKLQNLLSQTRCGDLSVPLLKFDSDGRITQVFGGRKGRAGPALRVNCASVTILIQKPNEMLKTARGWVRQYLVIDPIAGSVPAPGVAEFVAVIPGHNFSAEKMMSGEWRWRHPEDVSNVRAHEDAPTVGRSSVAKPARPDEWITLWNRLQKTRVARTAEVNHKP